jgi:hypothetical protein
MNFSKNFWKPAERKNIIIERILKSSIKSWPFPNVRIAPVYWLDDALTHKPIIEINYPAQGGKV